MYVSEVKHLFLCSSVDDHNAWMHALSLQGVFQGSVSDGDSGARGEALQLSDMSKARHVQQRRHTGDVRTALCQYGEFKTRYVHCATYAFWHIFRPETFYLPITIA